MGGKYYFVIMEGNVAEQAKQGGQFSKCKSQLLSLRRNRYLHVSKTQLGLFNDKIYCIITTSLN